MGQTCLEVICPNNEWQNLKVEPNVFLPLLELELDSQSCN